MMLRRRKAKRLAEIQAAFDRSIAKALAKPVKIHVDPKSLARAVAIGNMQNKRD